MNLKPKVLFVDDEPNFLSGIRRMLHKYRDQWDLDFAGSVDEALMKLSTSRCDLVITDMTMPGRNGFDLLSAIVGTDTLNDVPVVVLTGNAEIELKSKALELGASDLLNKPVIAQDLVARIKSTLRLKAYQDKIMQQNSVLEEKVAERTLDLEISRLEILWRLAKAGEYRDEETGNHTARVGLYCKTIAELLNLNDDFIASVFLTGPLHDIGKIGIPDGILLKPGKLTAMEWEIMKTHCKIGVSILKDDVKGMQYILQMKFADKKKLLQSAFKENHLLEMASSIAEFHHERWDGKGYPNSIAGNDIPLEARIVALADVFDALHSERPYKAAYSFEKTLDIIKEEKGKHFDPDAVRVFIDHFDRFKAISMEWEDHE